MSSTIDHEVGVVTITGAGYSWAEPGHQLYVVGSWAQLSASERRYRATFEDYLARIALSRGPSRVNEVTVRPDPAALLELVEGGLVHPSLVEEPEARAA